jgi:hypothetical protein
MYSILKMVKVKRVIIKIIHFRLALNFTLQNAREHTD